MSTILAVRVNPKTKKRAKDVLAKMGLTLSAYVNSSLEQVARTGEFETSSYRMTPYLEKIVENARQEYKTQLPKKFKTAKAFMSGLLG